MKKLIVLFAAVIMTLTSYAACNEYGWTCGTDMFAAFITDYNTFAGAALDVEACVATPEKFYNDTYGKTPVEGMFVDVNYSAKWGWLLTFLTDQCRAFQGKEPDMTASMMRGAIDNFFHKGALNSTAWNKSYDATEKGNVEDFMSWQSYWNNSWCVKEVCNDYGWMNAGDMYKGLAEDIWAYAQDTANHSTFVFTNFDTDSIAFRPASISGETGIAWDVEPFDLNFFSVEPYASKWAWLVTYVDSVNVAQEMAAASAGQANMRYTLTAFFANQQRASWPKSADFATCGVDNFMAWQPYWGQKWCTGGATVTVTYDLQGGVTNDYGWTNGEDMYQALAADVLKSFADSLCKGWGFASEFPGRGTFGTPDVAGVTGVALDIQTFDLTFWTVEPYASKWGWLADYIEAADLAAGQTNTVKSNSAYARYNLAAFFGNTIRGSWPATADFTNSGAANIASWQANWKHGFDNPTEFDASLEFDLNTPYKEGESFRGWFLDALGQGQQVTKMSSVYAGQTIYAVFGAYQPTIKEIRDTTLYKIGDEITTTAIVTAVSGRNVYIADASGMGILAYYSASQQDAIQAGQKLTVKGTYDVYNGFPELKNCETKALVDGEAIGATTAALTDLKADPLKYYGLPVLVKDIRISKYDTDGNMYVSDGVIEMEAYYIRPDQTEYKVGQRINLTAVVGNYKADIQFVGTVDGIEKLVFESVKDPNTYAPLTVYDETIGDSIKYNIESNWIFSAAVGNWDANKPAPQLEQCRGMVVKDGIIYMTWRSSNTPTDRLKLVRYDAATGEKLTDLILAAYIFQQPAADTTDNPRWYLDEGTGLTYINDDYEWNYAEFNQGYTFGPNTGMYLDEAGHILVADLPTSGTEYQVWMIDEKTGEGQLVIYLGGNSGASTLKERYPDDGDIRFDRFGVAGDVTKDATIFTMNMNSDKVYTFDIYDGKWDGEMWQVAVGGGTIANFGQAPQIDPVDGGASFYCSGSGIYPTLASAEDGTILESFNGVFDEEENPIRESCVSLLYNEAGNAAAKVAGCREFKVGGAYFFSMSAATWEGGYTPHNSHLLFRFKDENRHFDEMIRWTELPKDGFGTIEGVKNFQFTNVHFAVEKDELSTELYIWTAEYGLAKYTITADKTTGIQDVKVINADNTKVQKVIVDGQLYIIRNGVAYTAMGQIAE